MSAGFDLVIRGAQEQLWLSSQSILVFTVYFVFSLFIRLCWLKKGLQTVSMRLRSKRTGSGVECFGSFHIKRFMFLFLFFRGSLT
ncbi:hypothetical protein FRX31_022797 [Thalictrum thalictroides]|uniref:Uncharacterized protein n=1 Tax=Thalictrum thalictroides TaxID=46969 RepID=A0A7J6VTR5_THATH|nr:hypothetical protein FRX31_022797 [Thalictrum thalictroides]